ncbi:MAG: elongation factor P [Bacteroidetes bacterium]|nr:elongation factor P [Bacteroidota bacterium]MBP7400767.1 elongation factor P [Chitinophagales bacterium]MBK7108701.1 elongation factor P [Bacteroidota bacterium]MBK8488975.1 elongation factor P [Bacteroidota bacterium]MBK8680823.1 elongation factor P [Bacteroidota bacterium]
MGTTADFRNGLCIEMNNDIWQVVEFLHVKPGKGNAFVRSKLKSLTTGKVLENTFSSGTNLDIVRVERRTCQYLYSDEYGMTFMNVETFEQVTLNNEMVDGRQFIKEGQEVDILFHAENEKPLLCELPAHIVLAITFAEPGVKGNTATNAYKNATVETGANIQVPLFVEEGDKIKIDTRTFAYMERVK